MNTKHILTIAMAGLAALPSLAETEAPTAGDILDGINMFTPEEGDPSYKVKANEKYGTQWAVDLAYGYWATHRSAGASEGGSTPGRNQNYGLLHAQLNQRIIKDDINGGTWVRAEVSGSWGLDKRTANSSYDMVGSYRSVNDVHGDIFGPHHGGLPELAIMQYLQSKKLCVIGGLVNLTNYFDAVSVANDSFSGFTNTGFMNSAILPLVDSNLGVVVQRELGSKNYVMAAASRTGGDFADGRDPFAAKNKDGYVLVGEWGHIFNNGGATLRINPFYQRMDSKQFGEDANNHQTAGLCGSIEWTPIETVTLFTRTGWAAKQQYGTTAELSVGGTFALIPSREDDFFGLAAGVYKGAAPYGAFDEETEEPLGGQNHRREYVIEAMYSLQINDYLKLVPHYQYISRPAYAAVSDESLVGVQAVFSF